MNVDSIWNLLVLNPKNKTYFKLRPVPMSLVFTKVNSLLSPCPLQPPNLERDILSRESPSTLELCGFPIEPDFYLPDGACDQDICI